MTLTLEAGTQVLEAKCHVVLICQTHEAGCFKICLYKRMLQPRHEQYIHRDWRKVPFEYETFGEYTSGTAGWDLQKPCCANILTEHIFKVYDKLLTIKTSLH